MITGAHVIVYSADPEADRAFVRDVLGFRSVDAGDGWLIFKLPPAELALHPTNVRSAHELFLVCEDLAQTLAELTSKGVKVARPVSELRWGQLATITLPSGADLSLYQPRHPTAYKLEDRYGEVGP